MLNFPPAALKPTVQSYLLAQVQNTAPQSTPTPNYSIDPITALGYILAAGATTAMIVPKMLEKWFGGVMEAKQTKVKQELMQDQSINEGYMRQADRAFDILTKMLDTVMSNVLQTSRENKEIFYEQHKLIAEQTTEIKTLKQEMYEYKQSMEHLIDTQKDILNVLGMKEREAQKSP